MSIALNGDGIISGVSSISVGAGASVFSPAANTLALGTNGSERVRVGAAGSVGIGTDNPRGRQEIYITGAANGSTTNAIVIDNDNSSNGDNLATGIVWKRKGNSSSYDYSRIDSVRTGTHDTDIVFSTNYGTTLYEELRIKANGGITFNGDTAAANALDDYEEGTWTPAFNRAGTTVTHSSQEGYYQKVGNTVHALFYFALSAFSGGGSGQYTIQGLPFTSSTGRNYGGSIGAYSGVTMAANGSQMGWISNPNTTNVVIGQAYNNGTSWSTTAPTYSSSTTMYGIITYTTSS